MNEVFWSGLAIQIDIVFQSHSSLFDHRSEYPWLTGALGNPNSGIWFIAENPSLTQIERVQNPDGGVPTLDAQWWASRGDKLFREMLVKHGFKMESIDSPGGWNCYITNAVKETDYASRRREKTQAVRIVRPAPRRTGKSTVDEISAAASSTVPAAVSQWSPGRGERKKISGDKVV